MALRQKSPRQVQTRRLLDLITIAPQPVRPLIRAFLYGYASSCGPRLLSLILRYVRRSLAKRDRPEGKDETLYAGVLRILRGGFEWNRWPTFCAAFVGGSTLLQARAT